MLYFNMLYYININYKCCNQSNLKYFFIIYAYFLFFIRSFITFLCFSIIALFLNVYLKSFMLKD